MRMLSLLLIIISVSCNNIENTNNESISNKITFLSIDSLKQIEIRKHLKNQLIDYQKIITERNKSSISNYVHPSEYLYAKKKLGISKHLYNKELIQTLRSYTKIINSALNSDSIIFKGKILNNGLFLSECYIFYVESKMTIQDLNSRSMTQDVMLAISDDKGNDWRFMSLNSQTWDKLFLSYSEEIVNEIYYEKNRVFNYNISKIEKNLVTDLTSFYTALINYDTTLLISFIPDVIYNPTIFSSEPNEQKFLQELFSTSKIFKNIQEQNKGIVKFEIGTFQEKAFDNNNVFYEISGQLMITVFNKDTTYKVKENFLAISEDIGYSWSFLNFDPTQNRTLKEYLLTRYNDNVVKKIIN